MTDAALAALSTVVLPDALGLRRDHVAPLDDRGPDYDAGYDFTTLAYDAVHSAGDRRVRLICPPLHNLARVLREGEIRLDGRPAELRRIRRHRRHDVAELDAPRQPSRLSLAWRDWRSETPVHSDADAAPFAGRNCLVTVSRDNSLRWIRDWASFHARVHRADAALFFDNGSTEYRPEDVLATLADIAGLAVVRVVPVDRPYGPIPLRGARSKGMFLQAGLLNLARLRFLATARAVLQNDVDELVVSRSGRGIFDAAAASSAGFVKFRGLWRTPETLDAATPVHHDHVGVLSEDKPCPAKYCIVPSGRLRRHAWNVHNLDWLPFSRRFETAEFHYLHCRGITTRWKGEKSRNPTAARGVDAEARALLDRYLAPET